MPNLNFAEALNIYKKRRFQMTVDILRGEINERK